MLILTQAPAAFVPEPTPLAAVSVAELALVTAASVESSFVTVWVHSYLRSWPVQSLFGSRIGLRLDLRRNCRLTHPEF